MPASSVLHILRTIKERGPLSRTDLQQVTGLSWGTITNTTRELLQRNLIREEGVVSTKAGRKPVHLALNPSGHSIIGVEIAPGKVRCLMMNLAGETLHYADMPAPGTGWGKPQELLDQMAGLVGEALQTSGARACLGVGVAVPGAVDMASGMVRSLRQFPGWTDVPMRDFLRQQLNITVQLEHTPNCLALAERWFGEAGHAGNLLCIQLDAGVKLGVLLEGEVFRGSQGLAGEFGHMTLDAEGPPCSCGDRGCVEAYCSASAVLSHAQSVATQDNSARKLRTIEELMAEADSGNRAAKDSFERMGKHLGIGVANLIDLLNPDLIVLAGTLTAARQHFMPSMEQQVKTHARGGARQDIRVSRLGERATAMGACGMILQSAFAMNHHGAAANEGRAMAG